MRARFFRPNDANGWDDFCVRAYAATFLHSRRFLSYHGDRFEDCSVLVEDAGRLIGVLPAARHPADSGLIVSHPGSTFGGLVHHGDLRGAGMLQAFSAIGDLLTASGGTRLLYKVVPTIYHQAPGQDDLYALFRLGGIRTRCDLSSCIDLANRLPTSDRRRRGHKAALRHGIAIRTGGFENLSLLWPVLEANLREKHAARPVHSIAEMTLLCDRFPREIQIMTAFNGDQVEAGLVLFCSERVAHAQYIASSKAGQSHHALDLLFEAAIERCQADGQRYFDFGISTESQGQLLNEGLNRFKNEFGAGGVVYEFYEWNLEERNAFK